MMRLAYLCADPGVAYGGTKGASVHVEEVVGALAGAGAEVLLVVAEVAPGAMLPSSGVTLEVLPGPGKRSSAAERVAAEPGRRAWLERRLAAFGAVALYERLALHSAAGSAATRALGIPHLVELNAPLPAEAARYRHLDCEAEADRLEQTVLAGADLVLPVSGPLARYARERGARRVEVLPNAAAPERFASLPSSNGHAPVAVLAGSLRPWHGVETVAEAWRHMGRSAPGLLVVGDGPGRGLLEAVGARVTGTVAHADVPALLAGGDIGLAPYARDAPVYFSPLKLFEYLAAGLATVAADLPSVREIVSPETAVLVPRGDSRALADAVAALAGDPAHRQRLSLAGRALVTTEHTWAHRAGRILDAAAALASPEVRR